MTAISTHAPWKLITLPVSHYCENVRWALDRLNLPYEEEPHLLLFHRKITESLGGTTVPVLVTEDKTLTDSRDILKYIDTFAPADAKLYPQDPEKLQTVQALETLFTQTLGPATRCWGYFYLLSQDELLRHSWCQGVPKRERAMYTKLLPKMKGMVQEALNISETSAIQSLATIHQVFETVDKHLSDREAYLVGDSMTAADITFAALAAPIIAPETHPMNAKGQFSLPEKMMQDILACRKTKAGQFVLRMYRDRLSQ